ncbi:MAG: hypothetical protein LWW97_00295 [Deltaproteobacteria bacterium]|nr:hypothetical protein [Deltaproteobacteria bacterium]
MYENSQCQFNMSIDPVTGGGTAEQTLQMSIHLAKKVVKSSILTTDTGLNPEYKEDMERKGVNIYASRTLSRRFHLPICSFNTINKLIQQTDIIHLMNNWTILHVSGRFIMQFKTENLLIPSNP